MAEEEWEEPEAVEVPIDGTLDLHTFHPRDLKNLLPDYLDACRQAGILQVRVVHGKGTGQLRRSVHAILGRLPEVESFPLGWRRWWWLGGDLGLVGAARRLTALGRRNFLIYPIRIY